VGEIINGWVYAGGEHRCGDRNWIGGGDVE